MLRSEFSYIRKMYFCYFWYFNSNKIIKTVTKNKIISPKYYLINFKKTKLIYNKYIKVFNNNNLLIYFISFKKIPSQLILTYYFEIFFQTIKYYKLLFNYYLKQKQLKLPLF